MLLQTIAFYLFAAVLVASAVMVIAGRNPVHSVLFLILAFFNAAGLFVLLGAEFLAMILVIVYVGAVAVLFLFVVMMLDVDFAELKRGTLQYIPVSLVVGGVLLAELIFAGAGFPASYTGTSAAGSTYVAGQQDNGTSPAINETAMVSGSGTYSGTFTINPAANWSALIATFH